MSVCDDVRDHLPGVIDHEVDESVQAHVSACLRCQAEVAQYHRIGRTLRSFEPQLAVVPLGLHAAVLRALGAAQDRAAFLWKGALLSAGGLIVAAGTTAGILFTRHRHRVAS
jgi:anti-sigma factor RsiW